MSNEKGERLADQNASKKKLDKKSRGTGDDVEILRMILESEPILKRKVKDKMKFILAASKESVLDVAKKRHETSST